MSTIAKGLTTRSLRRLAVGTFAAGVSGMAVSYLYLASAHYLDVVAGAAGFVAGSILMAAGLVSGAVLRSLDQGTAVVDAALTIAPSRTDRWLAHFEHNQQNRTEPCWDAPVTLPAETVEPLVKSLAQFQLGDGGGPACLIAWNAEDFRSSSQKTRRLVDLWFKEEREHARLLGEAVARFGGRCISGHWSFSAFCLLRKWLGVRFELTILLLTEIVSTVYYRLLRRHGQDPALKEMCKLILRDEAGHVAFHRDRLAEAGRTGQAGHGLLWEMWFRTLGLAAGSVLYVSHARGLGAVGASTTEFYREIWMEMSRFIRRLRLESAETEQST